MSLALDDLALEIEKMLGEVGLTRHVFVERIHLASIDRLRLTRELETESRYLRITPVTDLGSGWDFEILGGTYGSADPSRNFDGRAGGDARFTLELVEAWLVNLASFEEARGP